MRDEICIVALCLLSVFLIQGETSGSISIGVPETVTSAATTTTIPPAETVNTPLLAAMIILALAITYIARKKLYS